MAAGGGTGERFEGKFNVNSFKGARQLSAIGMANNTNAEGFSFMDIINFTGELARMQRGGGGGNISISMNGDEAAAMGLNPGGRNSGINTAWGGGFNYNNIVGSKLDLQSNYFYNRFNPNQESHISRQYLLPDTTWYYKQDALSDNLSNSHRLNLNLLYQLDSMNTIRIVPSINFQRTRNQSRTSYQTLREDLQKANEGFSNSGSATEAFNFRNEISWRKKFAKRGRTFSLSLQTTLNQSDGTGSLSSINSFYTPSNSLLRTDSLNQQSFTTAHLFGYNARAVYTEPVWKRSLIEFSAGRSQTRNTSQKETFDYNKNNGKFDEVNEQLTNDFENNYDYTVAGLRLRSQRKKYNFMFGASWQQAELGGKIISGSKDSLISKTFRNILPNARFQYKFSRYRSFAITYNTATNQPSMSQLQPVPDNSNTLNIREGNPDLKQEFNHNIQANFNLVSPFKNRNFFLFLRGQLTNNKIVNYDTISQLGVRTTRPVNVNGVYNINGDISYSMPVRFLKGNIEMRSNTSFNNTRQYINGIENTIKIFSFGPSLRLDVNPTDKLNITAGGGFNYNNARYSLQQSLNTKYFSHELETSLDWEMPKGFFFSTDLSYIVNNQRASGFNTKIALWNASISKQMLRFNRGELKLSARDLLNQNIGISRNTRDNYIEDASVMTLRRYFLLSFTYSLSKVGLGGGNNNGGMRIITR